MTRAWAASAAIVAALSGAPARLDAQRPRSPDPAFASITGPIARILSGQRAYATTDYIQQFYRDPGSRGFDAALDSVVHLLAAAGYQRQQASDAPSASRLTYRIETRPIDHPVWSPLGATITLDGRSAPLETWSSNHDMLPGNSWPTPAGGVDAVIVNVHAGSDAALDSADLRGRIAYVPDADAGGRGRRGSRGAGLVQRVAARGAVGVLMGQQLPAYNRQEVNRTAIQFRSIPYDTGARIFAIYLSLAARDSLDAALSRGPVRAHVVTSSVFEDRPERTVVAEIRGSIAPDQRFVYSAHVQEPGANDNASGAALLAEMARTAAVMLRARQIDPGRTITMLWGVETEQTRRYVNEDTVRRAGIRWGMSLDMVGENTALTGGTFLIEKMPDPSKLWPRGEDQHTEWGAGAPMTARDIHPNFYNDFVKERCIDESNATGGSWVVRANPYEGGSDHTPFVAAGIPGVLLWHFTDQFYHVDLDRVDKVSAAELQHTGRCALAASLILTAGHHPEFARAELVELAGIAVARLRDEAALSRAAIAQDPGSAAGQRTILESWREYYLGALERVPDMTLPHVALTADIAAAGDRVRAAAADALASLAAP